MNTSTLTATPTTSAHAMVDTGLDTAGKFFPYNSAVVPTTLAGLRVITATYKQTAAMKAKGIDARNNVYVRVPTSHLTVEAVTEQIEVLAPFIVSYLQSVEDDSIRKYHKDGGTQVFIDTLSLGKVLATLEDQGTTGLNGEQITEWFTESVAPTLLEVLAGKMNTIVSELSLEQESKAMQVIQSYLDTFISLASGKTLLVVAQRERLAKCLEVTATDTSALGMRFIARFAKMEQKEADALNSLGDLEL